LSIHELASIVLAKEPTVTKLVGASPDGQKLASWVGMCPGNNESAGKRKSGRIRKGNAWVRRLLCEFAQAAGNKSLCTQPKSGSYPVVGKPDVGFGGPMMGAMRSLM
jgi:transposase